MKNNKGITLIALIITIIVMLILVSVSINIAIKSGLFEQAGKATQKYKEEQEKESNLNKITINGTEYNSIDDYLAQINGTAQDTVKWIYTENADGNIEITGIDLRGKESEKRTFISGREYGTITLKLASDTLVIPDKIDEKNVVSVSFLENIYDGMLESDDNWLTILGVKNLVFADSIEQIGDQKIVFADVEAVHLPSELKIISGGFITGPFSHLKKLTTITIPSKVETIEDHVFYCCINLSNVIFDGAPKTIGNESFAGCGSLGEITIPEGVEKIGDSFCACCSEETTINLPKSLKEFGGILTSTYITLNFPNGINENLTIPENKWLVSKIIIEGVEQ